MKAVNMSWITLLVCLFVPILGIASEKDKRGCDLAKYAKAEGAKENFEKFHKRLKTIVENDNREELAEIIKFPLKSKRVGAGLINSKDEFLPVFDRVITEHHKQVIEKQPLDQLFCNYQGVMFGRGEWWVSSNNPEKEWRIIAIN